MGKVYLLEEMGDKLRYKIGVTKNEMKNRVNPLKTGNSDDIMAIYTYESAHYKKIEKMLHRKFQKNHHRLEWFEMTDEQVQSFLFEAKKADETIDFMLKNNYFYNG